VSESRLADVDNDFNAAEANLTMALSLVQDCETAYGEAPDRLRRQFNQALFKRILIDDEYTVTGKLAEPFETRLSEELRQAAAARPRTISAGRLKTCSVGENTRRRPSTPNWNSPVPSRQDPRRQCAMPGV
jgi:hypothetical protein